MSLIISGPHRVYVLLLFCHRVNLRADLSHPLSGTARAMGAQPLPVGPAPSGGLGRPIVALRLQHVLWSRLVGLSFLVLDPQGQA